MNWFKNLFKKSKKELPKTYEEAIDYVAERIEADTVSEPMFHFTGGMKMRNGLGLWDKTSHLHKHMLSRFGLCHADDTGYLISQAANAKKNGKNYDPAEDIDRFKRHWLNLGLDPATMENIKSEVPNESKSSVFKIFISRDGSGEDTTGGGRDIQGG